MVRTLGVGGSEATLGRSAPGGPPMTAGEPDFLWRKSGERTPGRKRFFLPGPTFSSWGGPCGGPPSFFACPAALYLTLVTARPPAGRAGGGGGCSRKGAHPPPKPSPWGEGAPVRTLGRMRGRFGTQPFLVEKRRAPGCRLNEVVLLPRWATRSPPHQSPSVTASPQGEAFVGATPPQRNALSPNPCSRKMRIQIRARTWVTK